MTAREWRDANPDMDANMREQVTLEQLLVSANLENMNAEFIHMQLLPSECYPPDADAHRANDETVGRRYGVSAQSSRPARHSLGEAQARETDKALKEILEKIVL